MKERNLTQGQLLKALLDSGVTVDTETPVRLVDDLFPGTADYRMGHIAEDVTFTENGEMLVIARGNDSTPVHKSMLD